ncbi:SpoIIE family protein phosphatase [Streptomyces sp. NPDC007984]|uniref:SpoIIE family protein phosphatase n=1 Tax=Streptomyces sp. NPDC007984 TaxID=3364801 RepID=UPI0036E5279A
MRSPAGPGADRNEILPDFVLADVMRETGASVGMVYLLPPGEQVLHLEMTSGVSRQIAAPWSRIPVNTSIPVVDAMRERHLVWLGSQEDIARRYPRLGIVLPYDFMLAAAPIISDAAVWGGIVLLWPAWHAPQLSAAERKAITAGCHRAAALLDRATEGGRALRLSDEPRLLMAPPSREADPARAAAALDFTDRTPLGCCSLDLDGRITFINPAGAHLVDAGAAALLGNRLWEVLLWMHDPVFEDAYRTAVISRRPHTFTARSPADVWLRFQLYPDDRGISIHIAPVAGQHTGTEQDPRSVGTEQDPQRAGPVSSVGAGGLYHLTHLAAALAEAASVHDVVELAADQTVPAFGPRAMALLTVNEGRLRITGYRGYGPELMARFDAAPLTADTPAARAIITGAPAFFPTFADLKKSYPAAVHQDDMAAWAFLPLIVTGRPVGTLVLAYDHVRPFPPAERSLLSSLSGLIAQALDRARLYDAKNDLAHTLQTSLLPHTLPAVPGLDVAARYRPASHGMDIGGDFYDLIDPAPRIATAAIGDVQGHNTTAAALMGQVRTAVRAHATAGSSPGDILARTNRLLTGIDPGLFASCLVAHLDLGRHRARLATAGHPPPLLRHPGKRTETLRLPPGLLLGIDEHADYPTTEIDLPPGAVLALYTDGLVERPGTDIDDGITALAHQLTAEHTSLDDLADALIDHAERTAPRNDDIALLLLRPHHGT